MKYRCCFIKWETDGDEEALKALPTAHTLDVVPFVYVGRRAVVAPGGALKDIAPTMLSLMRLAPPAEMTGRPLVAPA